MHVRTDYVRTVLTALTLAILLISCGDDNDDTPPFNQPGGTNQVEIRIQAGAMNAGDDAYGVNPRRISPGTTVTWINGDSEPHTVTFDSGFFDSGTLNTGERFSHTFNDRGNFPYFCELHPNMRGTIIVDGTTTSTTPSSTSTTSIPATTTTSTAPSGTTTTTFTFPTFPCPPLCP